MIEEQGMVIALDGPYAQVRTERRSACGGCSANGACGTSLIERFMGQRLIQVRAINDAQAEVGERVIVGISEQGLLSASLALYLVPLIGLIGGMILGDSTLGHLAVVRDTDAAGLLGAALGFALALSWLRRYSAGLRNRPEQQAVVVCRLEPGVPFNIPTRIPTRSPIKIQAEP